MSNCTPTPNGKQCPNGSDWSSCKPWDITAQDRTNCYADSLQQETLEIAGARVNVHKLLGIHEQTKLLDLTGTGSAISGGDAPLYPASNAFTSQKIAWMSKQTGASAILASAYIGYDFGVVRLPNGRQRYGVDANVRQHITTIGIKQSSNAAERATKVRVERSEDGKQWYGVAALQLPNNDALNMMTFKQSAPSRYWRLRPLAFTGTSCDSWSVQALEMHDYAATAVDNIQDPILLENRDRDYQTAPVLLKGFYELMSVSTFLAGMGIGSEIPVTYQIKVNFNACVASLNRPIVVGDIIELPSETQYTPDLRPIKRYLEVSEVTWDMSSYTPGWVPTMLLVTAKPALASQETRNIFGDLASITDNSGLLSTNDGNNTLYQDFSAIDQTIAAAAKTAAPERGSEGSNTIREFSDEELAAASPKFPHLSRYGLNRTGLYVEDAMPQNGAPYTEGPELPRTGAQKNGDYHRLTYVGLAAHVPPRLYRWSSSKNDWVYLETDRRKQFDSQKTVLEEYTTSTNKKPAKDIR